MKLEENTFSYTNKVYLEEKCVFAYGNTLKQYGTFMRIFFIARNNFR